MESSALEEPGVPLPPQIEDTLIQRCRETGNFCPALFEWYKHVCATCNFFARIRQDSCDVRDIPTLHYSVLIALLNRCARLMLANIKLSHEGRFGEATAILDRCIFESVVKLRWLCTKGDAESFRRLVLDGLKSDIVLQEKILANIQSRGGEKFDIEVRMLGSIDSYLKTVSATEDEVRDSLKLPDLATMITVTGYDRILYIVGQRMGSHHVHGTWTALYRDYLEDHDGILGPRGHDCPTHAEQYIFVMRIVIDALLSFVAFVTKSGDSRDALGSLVEAIWQDVEKLSTEAFGDDFKEMETDEHDSQVATT